MNKPICACGDEISPEKQSEIDKVWAEKERKLMEETIMRGLLEEGL